MSTFQSPGWRRVSSPEVDGSTSTRDRVSQHGDGDDEERDPQSPSAALDAQYPVGQNFVSVLNNPRQSWFEEAAVEASLDDISPYPRQVQLPSVSFSDFKKFLEAFREPYAKFKQASHTVEGGIGSGYLRLSHQRRATQRRHREELKHIPAIFFHENFNLRDPDTWKRIFPPETTPAAVLLQEKLSHYLDQVEVRLLEQINQRSEHFFEALTHFQDLNAEVMRSTSHIRLIRLKLAQLDEELVQKSLKVAVKCQKKQNLLRVYEKLKVMSSVRNSSTTVSMLSQQGDFVGAIELMDQTMDLLGESGELRGLRAFGKMSTQLSSEAEEMSDRLEAEFTKLGESICQNIKVVADSKSQPTSVSDAMNFRDIEEHLVPVIVGLSRVRGKSEAARHRGALQKYKDQLVRGIKLAIKDVLNECLKQVEQEEGSSANGTASTSTPLADRLRALSAAGFHLLMHSVYKSMEVVLNRVQKVHDSLKAICSTRIPELFASENDELLQSPSSQQSNGTHTDDDTEKTAAEIIAASEAAFRKQFGLDQSSMEQISPRSASSVDVISVPTSRRTPDSPLLGDATDISLNASHLSPYSIPSSSDRRSAKTEIRDDRKPESSTSSASFLREFSQMSGDIVFQLCEFVHSRCAKLVSVRQYQHVHLSVNDFIELWTDAAAFISHGEKLCGRTLHSLRGTMTTQGKGFFDRFHSNQLNSLNLLLENELWTQAPVPLEFQNIVEEYRGPLDAPEDASVAVRVEGQSSSSSRSYIVLNGEKYKVVSSALMLLKLLRSYVTCAEKVQPMGLEIFHRVVELLKCFNSKTCQLVMGAGALKTAGLKSISAKHLVMAAQSLGFIVHYIPRLKQALLDSLPKRHHIFLRELDKVAQDFMDHQKEIYLKLVHILRDRVEVHCRTVRDIFWEDPSAPRPSEYMKRIVRETTILHKILAAHLPMYLLSDIFSQAVVIFNQKLGDVIAAVKLGSVGRERMREDVSYFLRKIEGLHGVPSLGRSLRDLVGIVEERGAVERAAPSLSSVGEGKTDLEDELTIAVPDIPNEGNSSS